MASIGVINNVGGKHIISGIHSNLDTNALINAKLSVQNETINVIRDQITLDNKKIQAINDFGTLLGNFKTTLDGLRFQPGEHNIENNLFAKRKVFTSDINGISSDNYLSITVKPTADLASFSLRIQNIASSKVQKSADFTSKTTNIVNETAGSDSSKLNQGIFKINNSNVTIASGDSLSKLNNKINALSETTNVTANIISPRTNKYNLVLTSRLPGLEHAFVITDDNNILNGLFATSNTTSPSPFDLKFAQDSKLFYDELIEVTRSSNSIVDFMDNVQIDLYHPTPGGEKIEIQIAPNAVKIAESLTDFVAQYNAISQFRSEQQQRTEDGKLLETSVLAYDNNMELIYNALSTVLDQKVIGLNKYTSIYDIGITTQITNLGERSAYNTLAIDIDTLSNALASNFEDVRRLFEMEVTASSSNLLLGFKRGRPLPHSNFIFDINTARPIIAIAQYTTNNSTTSINLEFIADDPHDLTKGGIIKGRDVLKGWEFKYIGAGTEIIEIQLTQGIADRMYYVLTSIEDDQILKNASEAYKQDITQKQDDINKRESRMESERERLLDQYAKMEAAIARSKGTVEQIKAQQEAQNNK